MVTFLTTCNSASPIRSDDRPVTPPRPPELSIRDLNPQTLQNQMSLHPSTSSLVVPPRGTSLASSINSADADSTSQPNIVLESPVLRPTDSRPSLQQSSLPPSPLTIQPTHPSLPVSLQPAHPPPPISLQPAHSPSITLQPLASSINTPCSSAISLNNLSYTASQTGLLRPNIDDAQHRSRESQVSAAVSLPDEAKLYITSMGESPLPSPHISSTAVHGDADQAPSANGNGALRESPTSLRTNAQRDEVGEFLDMDDDEREEEEDVTEPSKTKNKPHAAVEDFPMPPSHNAIHMSSSNAQSLDPALMRTPTQANPQPSADVSASSQAHRQQIDNASVVIPESPLPSSYLSPIKQTSSSGASATFRALPLLPGDLETTRVVVSHSSAKPNERGKEVLSFVIEVNPGGGKAPWKVEKLYSDVLGLDHRVRTSVGKGVGKKMAVLPEGKIWRDHAPAKSDQRKVSEITLISDQLDLKNVTRPHLRCISNR